MAATTSKEVQKAKVNELMTTLARLGGEIHGEDTIARHPGTQIILPEGMELETSVTVLQKKIKDEEQAYQVSRVYNYRPHDGARAVANVLREHFGWTTGMPVKTFFGTNPPQLMSVVVGVGETEQVPWGRLGLPHFGDGYIDLGVNHDSNYGMIFTIQATVRRKYRAHVEGFFTLVARALANDSIYRGRAVTASATPEYIDVSSINFEDVVYTAQVMEDLRVFVWANILYPRQLRDVNQLGKRVTILHGVYGTGKTLAAYLTAKLCEMQRTEGGEPCGFIMVRPGIDDWTNAIQMARLYGRCVIFIEDADLLVDPHSEQNISKMLDQFDGLISKGMDMSLVMTTNHIHKIHKGMLRPGRTDGLIEIGFMDRNGVEQLAKRVLGDMLEDDINFDNVFAKFHDFTPAYVKEVFDRALRRNLVRNEGTLGKISEHDLTGAADNLRPQLALMNDAPEAKVRPGLDGTFTSMIDEAVDRTISTRIGGATIYDGDDNYQGSVVLNS